MKAHQSFLSRRGFTLIELLVVISIIATLAALGAAAAMKQIENGRKLVARQACTSLVTAVNSFMDDNGNKFPTSETPSSDIELETDKSDFISILKGLDTSVNKRGTDYYSGNKAKGKSKKGGLVYQGQEAYLYDPWGGPYFVVLDGDYDGYIQDPEGSSSSDEIRDQNVIVYTKGADRRSGTKEQNQDNVYSYK